MKKILNELGKIDDEVKTIETNVNKLKEQKKAMGRRLEEEDQMMNYSSRSVLNNFKK